MDHATFRNKVWSLWAECLFSEKYWGLLREEAKNIDLASRMILASAALASVIGWFSADQKTLKICVILSGTAGIFACVIAPFLKFDSRKLKIEQTHLDWLEVERAAFRLWEEVADNDFKETTMEKRRKEIAQKCDEIKKIINRSEKN